MRREAGEGTFLCFLSLPQEKKSFFFVIVCGPPSYAQKSFLGLRGKKEKKKLSLSTFHTFAKREKDASCEKIRG